jgi:hypothetical protein
MTTMPPAERAFSVWVFGQELTGFQGWKDDRSLYVYRRLWDGNYAAKTIHYRTGENGEHRLVDGEHGVTTACLDAARNDAFRAFTKAQE